MKSIMMRLCALALALMLAVPVFALAEAPVDITADAVEAAVAAKDMSLTVSSNSTIDDGEDFVLDKTKSATGKAGTSFTIDLDGGEGLSWKSSNTKVATVEDGTVDCKGKGTAKITVKGVDEDDHSFTRVLKLTVKDDRKLVISYDDEDGETGTFKAGETVTAHAGWTTSLEADIEDSDTDNDGDVTWSTSNKKVVNIDKFSGDLVCLKPGKAKITATAKGDLKQYITINVKKNTYTTKHSKSEYAKQALDEEAPVLAIKSITLESSTKAVVTLVLFNGTEKKIHKLTGLTVNISADDGEKSGAFLSGEFGTVKAGCNKHSTKEFKLTFKGEDVDDSSWWLGAKHFEPDLSCDFDYE